MKTKTIYDRRFTSSLTADTFWYDDILDRMHYFKDFRFKYSEIKETWITKVLHKVNYHYIDCEFRWVDLDLIAIINSGTKFTRCKFLDCSFAGGVVSLSRRDSFEKLCMQMKDCLFSSNYETIKLDFYMDNEFPLDYTGAAKDYNGEAYLRYGSIFDSIKNLKDPTKFKEITKSLFKYKSKRFITYHTKMIKSHILKYEAILGL